MINNNVNLQRNIPFLYDERTLNTRPSLFGSEAKIKEKFSMTHISRRIYLKLCNFFFLANAYRQDHFSFIIEFLDLKAYILISIMLLLIQMKILTRERATRAQPTQISMFKLHICILWPKNIKLICMMLFWFFSENRACVPAKFMHISKIWNPCLIPKMLCATCILKTCK